MWKIPLSDISFDACEHEAVLKVLESRWLTMGPRTEEFEAAVAEKLNVRYAVAVSNCTTALQLAYEWVAQQTGKKKVAVPDITFVATSNAAVHGGLEPELWDIVGETRPFITEKSFPEQKHDKSLGTVAAVHYGGFDSGIIELAQRCHDNSLFLIEDAAHAIGGKSECGSKYLGTIGDAGCFSFFSNKNLVTGEGGMLVTNHEELAKYARLARSHGVTKPTWQRHQAGNSGGYDVVLTGHNFRCTEITAALGLEQLKKLDDGNLRRREISTGYINELKSFGLRTVEVSAGAFENGACHIFPLLCETQIQRDKIGEALSVAKIQTSHHYQPLHSFSLFEGKFADRAFQNADNFSSREITLPLFPGLKDDEISEIIRVVRQAVEEV